MGRTRKAITEAEAFSYNLQIVNVQTGLKTIIKNCSITRGIDVLKKLQTRLRQNIKEGETIPGKSYQNSKLGTSKPT